MEQAFVFYGIIEEFHYAHRFGFCLSLSPHVHNSNFLHRNELFHKTHYIRLLIIDKKSLLNILIGKNFSHADLERLPAKK